MYGEDNAFDCSWRSRRKRLSKIGGRAGVIVINKKGQFVMLHSTKYMASGYVSEKGIFSFWSIFKFLV